MSSMTTLREWIEPTAFTRRVGGFHLGLAGAIDLVAGAALVYVALTNWLLRTAYETLELYVDATVLLQWAERIAFLATDAAVGVGVVFVVVGVFQLFAGWDAIRGRRWRRCMGIGAVGVFNPVALPVVAVGLVCCGLTHDQFVAQTRRENSVKEPPERTTTGVTDTPDGTDEAERSGVRSS